MVVPVGLVSYKGNLFMLAKSRFKLKTSDDGNKFLISTNPSGKRRHIMYATKYKYKSFDKSLIYRRANKMYYCIDCHDTRHTMFAMKDDIWLSIANKKDVVCYMCAEKRLGRQIQVDDLKPEYNSLIINLLERKQNDSL